MRLIRTRNVGPVTYRQLLARFGSASAALQAIPDLARRGGGTPVRLASPAEVEREMEQVERLGARYLFLGDAAYPPLLADSDGAPAALVVRGDLALLGRQAIAMVGARNASAAACRFARGLAQALGEHGAAVVSGLARGIDTAAHQGSLATGTVAVVAGGLDIFYPPENEVLQRRIAEQGLLIAEMPPGTEPRARHFPYRNRIIAGLSAGTVVVEAAPRSGSLITARYAADFGREVMAVPGSPLDPRAQGCNGLIRDGAVLVQNADDVLQTLAPIDGRVAQPRDGWRERAEAPAPAALPPAAPTPTADQGERRALLGLLGPTPVAVDELVRQSGLTAAAVQMLLLELELAGRLERHAGGRIALG